MAATVSILHRFNRAAARSATLAIVLACALAGTAPPARGADDDMPARVGRIADFGGAVHVAPEDRANEWAEVGLNYPVVSGDNLWVSGDGRAEVDVGGGRLRLAGDTNVHMSRIDDRELSLFVAQGRVIVRLDVLDPGEVARIDTPNTQVTLLRPGLYRIEVSNDRQETTLVVREGEATAAVTNGLQQVLPGQTATIFGDQDVQADVRNGTGLDGFRYMERRRDRYYRSNRSAAYVSPQMVGAADLEQYGAWQTYPEYGAVWFPSTVEGGLGAVSPRSLGLVVRLGSHVGRRCAMGLCAVSLRPLGFHRRTVGLVPGKLRRAPGVGAGAGRVVRRWRRRGRRLRPGVWLGPARLARSVHSRLAQLLEPLLEQLQPAVCGERRRASAAAADALRQLPGAGGRRRCPVRRSFRVSRSLSIASICRADSFPVCRRCRTRHR
jgi:hypothetical protein